MSAALRPTGERDGAGRQRQLSAAGLSPPAPRSFAAAAPWLLAFVVAIAVTQIGSLGWEHVSDENTFTVMAAHVLDGNLPYVEFFDLKPPMIFVLLAGAMALFGESLLVVRAVGDLFLLASCVAVFAIARRQTGPVPAGLGALMLIAIHAHQFGQPTYTEVPAAAMLMAALWLLLAQREQLWGLAAAGLLLSLATLTRTDLGIVAAALGVWLAIAAWGRPRLGIRPRGVVLFAAAGLVPPGLLVLLYWQADALAALYLANVAAPISHAGQRGMWAILLLAMEYFEVVVRAMPLSYLPFCLTLAAGLAVSLRPVWRWRSFRPREQRDSTNHVDNELLWLALGATCLALLARGNLGGHSQLQLYPICAIFCALGIGWLRSVPYLRWPSYLLPAIAFAGAVSYAAPEALRLAAPGHLSERHAIRAAAKAVAAARTPHDTIYAFRYQLIYWYLDMMPASPVVHPNSLGVAAIMRPLVAAGYVADHELRRILDLRPTWLVTVWWYGKRLPGYFSNSDTQLFLNLLARDYRLFYEGGDPLRPNAKITIYRRNDCATMRGGEGKGREKKEREK